MTIHFFNARVSSKKSVLTLTALSFALLLSACGGSDDSASVTPSQPNPPTTPDNSNPTDTNWQPVGGAATIAGDSYRPFLQIIPNLPSREFSNVSTGRELFVAQWQPANQGQPLLDGLGPLFNANACTQCHSDSGRKAVYLANGELSDAILFRLGDKTGLAHADFGEQLQQQSIDAGILSEGRVRFAPIAATSTNPAGIQFHFTPSDSNQSLGATAMSGRISPQLLGMGLLDLIPEADIIAASNKAKKDGVKGRVHFVDDNGQKKVGRFGWKAINPSLRVQNANAMSQDMGLTSSVFLAPNCTVNQPSCWTRPNGGSPEVSDSVLDAVTDFMTALAVPDRRIDNLATFNEGAQLFDDVGCASCHTPKQKTGNSPRFALLANQVIYPYTDLLLHDMGSGLDDGVKEKGAQSFEWRTPPLWGIGITAKDPNARFLHDGRASSITEAILWHGGEAATAKSRFEKLDDSKKQILLNFINWI